MSPSSGNTNEGKGKAVPLQAWSGPEGSRKLMFLDLMTTVPDGARVVNLTYRPPIASENAPRKRLRLPCQCGPGSSAGIATRYGLDGPGIESRWGRNFPHLSRTSLGSIQPPVQQVPGLSWG